MQRVSIIAIISLPSSSHPLRGVKLCCCCCRQPTRSRSREQPAGRLVRPPLHCRRRRYKLCNQVALNCPTLLLYFHFLAHKTSVCSSAATIHRRLQHRARLQRRKIKLKKFCRRLVSLFFLSNNEKPLFY